MKLSVISVITAKVPLIYMCTCMCEHVYAYIHINECMYI